MKKLSNTEAELKKIIMLCHACLKQKLHNKDYITKASLPYARKASKDQFACAVQGERSD